MLAALGSELRFLLITSNVTLRSLNEAPQDCFRAENLALAIEIQPSENPKCARCWHRQPDVGSNPEHPELCVRCVNNITGLDETRSYV